MFGCELSEGRTPAITGDKTLHSEGRVAQLFSGREFDPKNQNLLTVHHKDGDHKNNPPDGSNWENLCVYCHEDEHSRGLLGDYLTSDKRK